MAYFITVFRKKQVKNGKSVLTIITKQKFAKNLDKVKIIG